MNKKRGKEKNSKTNTNQKEVKTVELDSLDSLIAQLPLPPLHSFESTESFEKCLLETSDVFPEDLEVSVDTELAEKIALLEAKNEELVAEQKKMIKTSHWKIGNLENQLKWQREENLRIIAEREESDKKNDRKVSRNRREIAALEDANKKLIEENRLLSDDKSKIEILLVNQKNQDTELLAEQKKVIKTKNGKIGCLERQLKVQKDENSETSKIIASLKAANRKLIEEAVSGDRSTVESLLINQKNEHDKIVRYYEAERKARLAQIECLNRSLDSKDAWKDMKIDSLQLELDYLIDKHTLEMASRTGFWYHFTAPFKWFWSLRKQNKCIVILCYFYFRRRFAR